MNVYMVVSDYPDEGTVKGIFFNEREAQQMVESIEPVGVVVLRFSVQMRLDSLVYPGPHLQRHSGETSSD